MTTFGPELGDPQELKSLSCNGFRSDFFTRK
jgi:hypothetical protein